ncbi:EpsG family protein [Brachymonas sp. G13]|uniref:EpsG family protein n=1 Tax=Brachymonas wangyanguii TaxID=3130163 RepID=UPI00307D055E
MLFYLLPLIFLAFAMMVGKWLRFSKFVYVPIGAMPMVFLSLARGNVGVDTPNYVSAIYLLRMNGDLIEYFEPLFERLLLLVGQLPVDDFVVLAIISFITTILLLFSWLKIEERPLILFVVMSQFYVDMTMNGIRYGLAFGLVSLAALSLIRRPSLLYWPIIALGSGIQVTSGFLGLFLYLIHHMKARAIVFFIAFSCVAFYLFGDHILIKLSDNQTLFKPSLLSGIVPLVLSMSLLIVWYRDKNVGRQAFGKIAILLLLSFMAYGVSQYSYAGLRLQLLIVFMICLVMACHQKIAGVGFSRQSSILIMLIGIFFGLLKIRNFAAADEYIAAPFIPYLFFWESY